MEISVKKHADHVEVEIDGMSVVLGRSSLDGALYIDVCTEDLGVADEHPNTGVPRLRLAINEAVNQLDEHGEWVDRAPYPTITVLDHIVAETK